MKGYIGSLESITEENRDFRRVLYTGKNLQLVLMSIKPGEEIGEEVHSDRDQFFRVESGEGTIWIDGRSTVVKNGDAVIVPATAKHNVINTGKLPLQLYTLYGPPEHKEGTVRKSRVDAIRNEEHFDGKTTEQFWISPIYRDLSY